jgi:hypothetical protein
VVVGLAFSYFIFWRPWSRWLAARFWKETPCTVVSSRVAEGSDGGTYWVDLGYAYVVDGREYRGSRYDFVEGSTSGYDRKAAIVARYPAGTRATCWVDPADPSQSVLSRDFSSSYLFCLLPLILVATGVREIARAFQPTRKKRRAQALQAVMGPRPSPFGVESPADAEQPQVLKPPFSPPEKLFGLSIVALVWYGIASILLFVVVGDWRSGKPESLVVIVLVSLVLCGLGLIFGVFRQFLVLFNPRLELTLSRGALVPGEAALLQWKIEGRATRVTRLKIILEGREEATYRRGTDTVTDREVFATISIIDTDQPMQIAQGSGRVHVPDDTMPSFSADRNKIVWTLKAACEIPGWPDSDDEYEIVVAPASLR